ncbi:MAG: hypothetical protein IKN04_22905 [Clostridia bacterium]|nr:hypothetical protein [Clostridia bacterium]MBR6184834.1 hypothetical protein [Clostridia bacterium]
MKKIVSIIIAVIIIMSLNSSTFAETISGSGYESASSTFYAEATGNNATIYFKQTKALAVLNYVNFWTEEWGCYHIYYTYNGTTYSTEWNNVKWNADNETFSLDLPYKGIYKIQIVAYTAEEINDLYAITHFSMWFVSAIGNTGPEWWVDNCYNCWVSNSPIQDPTPAPTVTPRKIQTTTPPKTITPAPSGQMVFPYSWDTQFKPSLNNGLNSDQYRNLNNLSDNNQYTTFWWVIWKNERTDSYPEITAYFNNATISSVGIRNGNPNNYYGYARAKRFRVEIYTNGSYAGSTYIYLNDQNSSSYQIMSLGRTYNNVTQIDFYLDGGANEGFYEGSSERYYIHIADIQFYN